MKRLTSNLLLLVYATSSFHFQEFLKVPILIDHYKVHLSQNPEMNVLDFVYEHYIQCDIFVSDYDQNMKLPFKGESKTCENPVQICINATLIVVCLLNINETPIHLTPCFKEPFFSQFLNSIWQPPKLA